MGYALRAMRRGRYTWHKCARGRNHSLAQYGQQPISLERRKSEDSPLWAFAWCRRRTNCWSLARCSAAKISKGKADSLRSSHIILGVYLIIFGAGKRYHRTLDRTHQLTPRQALLCLSSRFLSKSPAMPPSCSLSLAVVSVCESQALLRVPR